MAVDGDGVVVVEDDQVAQREVAGQRARLVRDALHQVAVGGDHEHAEPGIVAEPGLQVRPGDRHADRRRDALAERAGRRLDARRVSVLGMPRGHAAPLAEALQLVQRQVVAGQVQQRVEQHAAVPGGQHEPVAAGPVRVRRVVSQVARPEDVRHRRRAHRQAGMARLRLLDGVDRERADGVDPELVDVVELTAHGRSCQGDGYGADVTTCGGEQTSTAGTAAHSPIRLHRMATTRGGIDLGGTKIQAIIVDDDHQVLGQARHPTPKDGGPQGVADGIVAALRRPPPTPASSRRRWPASASARPAPSTSSEAPSPRRATSRPTGPGSSRSDRPLPRRAA